MHATQSSDKSLLRRQDVTARRRALTQKRVERAPTHSSGRLIVGVTLLATSFLGLLSLATFEPVAAGATVSNAVGPVGHSVALALRSLLGVVAYALPLLGMYTGVGSFVGNGERRRWPQLLCLVVLLVSAAILAHVWGGASESWPAGVGGVIGRSFGTRLLALFSVVGTVVLVSSVAVVTFIIGTRYAALRAVRAIAGVAARVGSWLVDMGTALMEHRSLLAARRREAALESKREDQEFFSQLEQEENEISADEAAIADAALATDAQARAREDRENLRRKGATERERLIAERERLRVEREAARLAREALRKARIAQRDTRSDAASAIAQAVAEELNPPTPFHSFEMRPSAKGDPKWASLVAPPPVVTRPPSTPEVARTPLIVQAPVPPAVAPPRAMPEDQQPETAIEPPADAQIDDAFDAAFGADVEIQSVPTTAPQHVGHQPLIVAPKEPPKPTHRPEFQFIGDRTSFNVPPLDVLELPPPRQQVIDKDAYLQTAERLTAKLKDFGIDGEVVEIRPGPVVTMYEFKPAAGVKISRIASLSDDLAMAMEAMRVRIVAPIPGKGVVGIEVPNREREGVFLREIAEQDAFQKGASKLTMCLGKDIEGMPYILDLAKAPHLLMAGTTGSGKSVSVNAMIMSILLKSTPEEVRFIMVDPKMLELSVYEGIPHLLLPVVTDPRKAAIALQWAVEEMTRRYRLLADAGARNITGYNAHIDREAAKNAVIDAPAVAELDPRVALAATPSPLEAPSVGGKKRRMYIPEPDVQTAPADFEVSPVEPQGDAVPEMPMNFAADATDDTETAQEAKPNDAPAPPSEKKKLPYIVVVIDELADLMMVASKEVETSIARLAQMARAAGIHLMVATQRPSTDVVTGIIKANFPTRISFMLRSKPDSMTILGTTGAEALLGMGDMLIMPPTSAHMQRVHGCYVSEVEIKRAVDHLKAQGKPMYDESILRPRETEGGEGDDGEDELSDELYDEAIAIVSEMRQVSISMLQRKMRIGYNRSARMIERMERDGLVGPADGAKPRDVLVRPIGQMPGTEAG